MSPYCVVKIFAPPRRLASEGNGMDERAGRGEEVGEEGGDGCYVAREGEGVFGVENRAGFEVDCAADGEDLWVERLFFGGFRIQI